MFTAQSLRALATLIPIAVSGCTMGHAALSLVGLGPTPLTMTYTSDPPGAMLYESGRQWGYTPVTLTYPGARDSFRDGECVTLGPSSVRWASGAEARSTGVRTCPDTGYYQQYVFVRPLDAPGRDIDAQFALQLQRNAILQQQAEAQEAAAVSGLLLQRNAAAAAAAAERSKSIDCTSKAGANGTVQTSCN